MPGNYQHFKVYHSLGLNPTVPNKTAKEKKEENIGQFTAKYFHTQETLIIIYHISYAQKWLQDFSLCGNLIFQVTYFGVSKSIIFKFFCRLVHLLFLAYAQWQKLNRVNARKT